MDPSAAAFQIIVLGGGGGPIEDDVVGLLVRSTATGWAKNSVLAVDAGVHLSGIVRILDDHLPGSNRQKPSEASSSTGGPRWGSPIPQSQTDTPKLVMTTGPFRGLLMPSETAKANAHHLLRNFITTYLITHPHLDHLSGFTINTAAFQHTTRPKKLAALPSTINAFKQHIFNDVVWPNLSDEEGGAGLVSFQRLTEGGNLALGDGEGIGYIEVCDGLAVKAWGVSHGKCMKQHTSRSSVSPNQDFSFGPSSTNSDRRGSRSSIPLSPGYSRRKSFPHGEMGQQQQFGGFHPQSEPRAVDSSAFFILDEHTHKEVLIFGDVEPDSLSLSPRTARVWADAAPKIVAGLLCAIFIECSYDDSQSDETLFGHLNPRHLVAELCVLADKVHHLRTGSLTLTTAPHCYPSHPAPSLFAGDDPTRKRKRESAPLRSPTFWSPEQQRGRGRSPLSTRKPRSSVSPGTQPPPATAHMADDEPVPHRVRHTKDNSTDVAASTPNARDGSLSRDKDRETGMQGVEQRLLVQQGQQQQQQQGQHSGHQTNQSKNQGHKQPSLTPQHSQSQSQSQAQDHWAGAGYEPPLKGLNVVIIHVKDTMRDGPPAAELVLRQLRERVAAAGIGCEVEVARKGGRCGSRTVGAKVDSG